MRRLSVVIPVQAGIQLLNQKLDPRRSLPSNALVGGGDDKLTWCREGESVTFRDPGSACMPSLSLPPIEARRCFDSSPSLCAGAGRGNRTPMVLPPRDFESRASTNSAIPAKRRCFCCCIPQRGRIIAERAGRSNMVGCSNLAACATSPGVAVVKQSPPSSPRQSINSP